MVHDVFEGANDPYFNSHTLIFEITERPSYMETKRTLDEGPFKYVRYRSTSGNNDMKGGTIGTGVRLAEISFYDRYNNRLN